ncbi:hypothetical protein C7M84_018111 [Penaeus vannamei]|uniref:Uncharacterized protein n=1 Tax=Penaeus vannamei TaxID=6689 RepID=A0A3R7LTI1_PENVA|nr:hypothetical protein C7M84_018111 [Penaeus vannamei]
MEGPVSGRVGCGPAPPTIGRGGWVRGRGWRSGLPGGAGSAGRRSRAPPLACCVAAAGAAARLPLGPFPRAAAWPERAGGAAACPARPFSHVFLGWPGDGLGFSLPLRPPRAFSGRGRRALAWPGLPASSSLEQGLALASPHQPLAPSRAEGGGVALPHPRRGVAPAGRARAGPGRGRVWLRACADNDRGTASAAGGGGRPPPRARCCCCCGRRRGRPSRPRRRCRARPFPAPASPAPVPESGAGFGGPGCRGRRRGCLPWPPGPSGPCPRSCGLRARADNYRGDHLRRLRAASSPSGPVGGLARAVRGILLVGPRPPGGRLGLSCPLRPLGPRAEAAAGGPLLPALHPRESEAFTGWVVGRAEGVLSLGVAQEGPLFAVVLAEGPRRQL